MKKFISIGAYWYSRKASLRESTKLLFDFFNRLNDLHPYFPETWYKKGKTKENALKKRIELTYESVKKLFSGNGNDDSYPQISFYTELWNGAEKDEEIISLSVSIGSNESKRFANYCLIELPYKGELFEFYRNEKNQNDLINLLKDHWNPEWVLIDNINIKCK